MESCFGGDFIFEDVGLWVFVDEDGDLGVFMDEDMELGCEREGVWEEDGHIGVQEHSRRFYESLWGKDRNRRGVPRENNWYIVPICFPR